MCHPGVILADDLSMLGRNAYDLAEATGLPVNVIREIIVGSRGIGEQEAVLFASALGGTANSWLSVQADYDGAVHTHNDALEELVHDAVKSGCVFK